jgi:DNA-binding SARP family transcriptional activator
MDGTQAGLEAMVVKTALKGAEHFLRRGLAEEAEWMIRRGLQICPYDERLYRGLLRAAEAKGSRLGVRSAMVELLCLVAESGCGPAQRLLSDEPERVTGALHPQTVALYRELAQQGA